MTGWIPTTIGALGRLHCGQSPKSSAVNTVGRGVPYVSGPEQWDGSVLHQSKWTTAANRLAPARSIFITVKGAGVGTLFPGIAAAIGRDIYAFEPHENIDIGFVYRALQFSIQDVIAKAHGDIPGLSKSHILQHPISVPGVSTQRKVSSKIDELFSEIEEGERALERAQKLVERYRQSVLKTAVTGELTRSWRETRKERVESGDTLLKRILKMRRQHWETTELERLNAKGRKPVNETWKQRYQEPVSPETSELPQLPQGWAWASLDMLADITGGITVDKKRNIEGCERVPYLRVANVQRGYLDLSEIKEISAPVGQIEELRLVKGDILFNEGGDLDKLGRGWIWEDQLPVCIHQNHVFRARLFLPGPWSRVISWYANVLGKQAFMDMGKQTTNLASISLSKLKTFAVPVMCETEATEMVNRAEDALSVIDRQQDELRLQQSASGSLRRAVLNAAFSGTLVDQDPADSPATSLLNRLDAERSGSDPAGKFSRKKGVAA